MGDYKQSNRPLKVETPLGPDVLLLSGFTIDEGISQLYSIRVEMFAVNEDRGQVAFEKLIGQKMTVKVRRADEGKYHPWNGVCIRFGQGQRDETFTTYYAELAPDLWKLTRKTQSRVFQRVTVPEILRTVLEGLDVSYELQGAFEPRNFCVQYRETDFAFASRLMEEEGIFYFFRHSEGSNQLVVANTPDAHPDVPGPADITYEELVGGTRDDDRIWGWRKEQQWRSGKVLLWDHSFELPHRDLEAQRQTQDSARFGKETHKLKLGGNDAFELYDWPGEYAQRFDGVDKGGGERPGDLEKIFRDNDRTVRIRMEEETALALTGRGESNVKHLVSGHRFTLKKHFSSDGAYVLTTTTHEAKLGADYRSEDEPTLTFSNSFTALPVSVPYRPQRKTPRPVIAGCQTAVVVGPKGEEIFTDKYGRVKVQFHWDREKKLDEGSSCWLRVGTVWAGRQWGAIHIPRIGQEVIVEFVEGSPDEPIIVGSVYNADTMPPYKLPEHKTRSGIMSRSSLGGGPMNFNEIRFEDKKGKEQLYIHAEKNQDIEVENDETHTVGVDRSKTIGRSETTAVGKDRTETVGSDESISIGANRTEAVGSNESVSIGANRSVDVGANDGLTVGANLSITVGSALSTEVGHDASEQVGKNQQIQVGKKFALVAGDQIQLQTGSASLTMKKDGTIVLKGKDISITGSGKINVKGSSKVTIKGSSILEN